MNLVTIAWKSIRQRGLASSLTALSIALGVMMMVAVLVAHEIVQSTFSQRAINYDLIIGAKGSPLQLVLSTVYHITPPIENLPYRYLTELKKDARVKDAIPVTIGDTTEKGHFPIVGTVPEFFDLDYAPRRKFLVKGEAFRGAFDAYIGSRVAIENQWTVGTKLKLVHSGAETHVHDEEFTVVGLLAPTGTPHDKTVYVNLEGFNQIRDHDKPLNEAIRTEREFFGESPLTPAEMDDAVAEIEKKFGKHDHAHADHGHHGHVHAQPPVQKQVTAILVNCKSPVAAYLMGGEMKKGFKTIGVNPIEPMQKIYNEFIQPVQIMFLGLAALIVVVSGIGIFVSIYNSMTARRREIAIMRALGAQRSAVLLVILLESIILCVGGGLVGLLFGHGLIFLIAPFVELRTGMIVHPFTFSLYEPILFPVLFGLGAIVGLLPGMTAYRTDVAESLNS